ncbi:MAG: DUF86 domain-containing protein [Bythopirellula sp.]|nr:DUF86 domain-containing protein [Bythopirellula sp.]
MKEDRIYLAHIRDAIERIDCFTSGGRDHFLGEPMVQDAVIRNLEVIGEAVKGLSMDLRTANPDLPWQRIAGMRDVLIHHYFGVKLETVWQVVVDHLPQLRQRVKNLLDK